MNIRYTFFFTFFLFFSISGHSQEINLQLGPGEIALNEAFTISIVVKNDKIRTYNSNSFPDIPGFSKRGTSSSSSTSIINGHINSENSITMSYAPQREGTFQLEPFEMSVNGETVSSSGKTITVGPPKQQSRRQRNSPFGRDPFDDFFGDNSEEQEEFIEIADDAFLGFMVDKESVYVGEGFTGTLAFYISDENRAPLSFYDLGTQLGKIVKELKPTNTWEENFEIVNIQREDVKVNGKRYSRYKLYQSRFYPLNQEDITFPAVGLKMIKYKVSKRPSFFGRRQEEDYKTYRTKPKTVKVKELPPHPLKDQVSVGDFQLREKVDPRTLETGESFNYSFSIVGQGNISAINEPTVNKNDSLTIYEPNVTQNTRKDNGTVIGVKQFSYYGIPNEAGKYKLKDYFYWIYFNPNLANYDTLRSSVQLTVTGESRRNESIQLTRDPGTFYNRMENESNALMSLQEEDSNMKLFINIFILVMLAASAFIVFKK